VHLKAGPEKPYDKNQVWFHLPQFMDSFKGFCREGAKSYDLIHSHYWLSGWVGTKLRATSGIPLLHMFHTLGYFKNKATRSLGTSEPTVRLRAETQLMKHTDHIVVSSQREKVQIIWTYGTPSEKISVIPCGVDSHLFQPRDPSEAKAHLGLPQKKFILYVGRIDPVKGIDTLLKAMATVKAQLHHPDAIHLLVIGGDVTHAVNSHSGELHNLKQLAAQLDIKDYVTFLGAQRQDQLPYFYTAADACVLPSRYESFGMVALEAMSCGTPVIASKVGGLSSFIQEGKTGFLIPEDDEKALAEKILRLLHYPSLKDELGTYARIRAIDYSWQNIAHRMTSLYRHVLAAKGKGRRESVQEVGYQ
jgi:D-inositol-3-phosphate glycosyltransferase